ncbi:MAG: sensor histidine kinase [Limnohabitans sp.]|jgi:signal transduction histidine kinase|uniref:sensor histidine kinase n=1 Tax=Limnohabitans sp. TaxID=1907725 RepID=UPI0025DA3C14|nr:HAMP domain-containing sensor histidine kinase [Limnohabitans sp.]MCO4087943.1 sensor histidine kinase [Limnohabitans sp.]
MLNRLPYRLQIPLGLSLAVLVTAMLVTALLAKVILNTAERETIERINRASTLIVSQSRSLIAAEDIWRTFTLLRGTNALLPGADDDMAHAVVLDSAGHVFASSNPTGHAIGQKILGTIQYSMNVPETSQVNDRISIYEPQHGMIVTEPIRSEDGQILGYVYIEVDTAVFVPAWMNLLRFAVLGAALTAFFLLPVGWYFGRKMAKPVAEVVHVIEQIGKHPPNTLRKLIPRNANPELAKIGQAVLQLLDETETRHKAQARAFSSQRLAAVGRITAVVAHEINNPLAGLLTATQTLRLHGSSLDIRQKTIELIERGLLQISSTVNALIPQARKEVRSLVFEDLADMTTLVQSTAERFTVQVHVDHDIQQPLKVAAASMRQVMLNLLLNAIKASHAGGLVLATLRSNAHLVRFEVSNTGRRLTQAHLDAAISTESENDPHGFGLWVCHQIAIQCNGSLILDLSEQDQTRLIFQVPNQETHEPTLVD